MKKVILSFVLIPIFLLIPNVSLVSIPLLENKTQAPKQEQHEVTVTLKLIQVYVTDKDGKSAMDLELKDFI
ncbi:MAG: hypothetical protein PVI66_08340 [Candidatus Aminicenantes bacterium]